MNNNHYLEKLEKNSKSREEKKRKVREMKKSCTSVFQIQEIIKEKNAPKDQS